MAVPKKKISHSKTRKRFLRKRANPNLYMQCTGCSNFVRLHTLCLFCSNKGVFKKLNATTSKLNTNINNVFDIGF